MLMTSTRSSRILNIFSKPSSISSSKDTAANSYHTFYYL
jgi:hypothetical protein